MKNMYRKIALISMMVLAVSLTACSNKKAAEETAEEPTTNAAYTTEELKEQNEAKVNAVSPVKPGNLGTVELGNYKGLTITTAKPIILTDEDVDVYIKNYMLPNAAHTPLDEVVEGADAYISYEGEVDGEVKPECCSNGTDLVIGSGQYIAGFEDGLIGAKKGDVVTLNLKFPEDYYSDLAGKDAKFTVTVLDITMPKTELTDEVAEELSEGQFDNAKDYRAALKEYMQKSDDLQYKQQLLYDAATAALGVSTITPTDEAIEYQKDVFIINYDSTLMSNYGAGLTEILSANSQTYDEFRNSIHDYCVDGISRVMMLNEIAKKEGIVVDDKAIDDYIKSYDTTLEKVLEVTTEEELKEAILEDLAAQVIVDNGTVEYTEEQ